MVVWNPNWVGFELCINCSNSNLTQFKKKIFGIKVLTYFTYLYFCILNIIFNYLNLKKKRKNVHIEWVIYKS